MIPSGISPCADVPMSILDGSNGFITEGLSQSDVGVPMVGNSGDINSDGVMSLF